MCNEKFYEVIEQIKGLGQIKSIAYRVVEDAEDFDLNVTYLRAEDVSGKAAEICLHNPYRGGIEESLFNQDAVLVQLLLCKLYAQREEPANDAAMNILISGVKGLIDEINKARMIYPYLGKAWLNEDRARLYDHVSPEYLI